MNDAGAFNAADAGEFATAVVEERIDESAVRVSWGWVDDDAVCFVEDDEVIVLEKNGKGDVLCFSFEGDGFWESDRDDVAAFDRVSGFGWVLVDEDVLVADEGLDARAGEVRELGGQERVEALGIGFDEDFHGSSICEDGKGIKIKSGREVGYFFEILWILKSVGYSVWV